MSILQALKQMLSLPDTPNADSNHELESQSKSQIEKRTLEHGLLLAISNNESLRANIDQDQQLQEAERNSLHLKGLFQCVLKFQPLPQREILDSIQKLVNSNLEKCVIELMKAIQMRSDSCLQEAHQALQYLPSDCTDHSLKSFVYFFLVVNKQTNFVELLKNELEQADLTEKTLDQICWKVWLVTQDPWYLEICWKNAVPVFNSSSNAKSPQNAQDRLLEITFAYISCHWQSFHRIVHKSFTEADQHSPKLRGYVKDAIDLLPLSYHSILTDVLGRFELFRLRMISLFHKSHLPSELTILNTISGINNTLAMEISLFKHRRLHEPFSELSPEVVKWPLIDSVGAFQHLRRGMFYFDLHQPEKALPALQFGINEIAQCKHHGLISKFQVEMLSLERPKGVVFQDYVSCALDLASRTNNVENSKQILENCASQLELLSSALLGNATMPLTMLIDIIDLDNLFVILYSRLQKCDPENVEYSNFHTKYSLAVKNHPYKN